MDFSGKRALVTGAAGGIGSAIARLLRSSGAIVAVADRDVTGVEADAHLPGDLTNTEYSCGLPLAARDALDGLDVVVNNAGVMQESKIEDISLEDWHRTLMINLTAPFLIIKAAMSHLRKTGGRIVNVGSIEGLGSNSAHAAYCASKAGLHGLTRAVAVDHGTEGVRCNAVAPGWIDTNLNEGFIGSMEYPASFRTKIGRIHPVGRSGDPSEVAALVAFLAAAESGFVTGQIYAIDGGRMSQLSLP
ncbi:MAG: SDR family oxidoreductase [Paracoccaceae bacterium]|nr:SDR family oxidoreductase [Paracoccaceae bacterium]